MTNYENVFNALVTLITTTPNILDYLIVIAILTILGQSFISE